MNIITYKFGSVKMRTLRQIFGDWKKSKIAFEIIPYLLKKQCYICPITKKYLTLGNGYDISHIIPLNVLESKIRPINEDLAVLLTTSENNLFLEDSKSNRKRKDKIDENIYPMYLDLIEYYSLDIFKSICC